MADDADRAAAIEARMLDHATALYRGVIAAGEPGTCRDCGHLSPRLVGGRCAFCRDGRVR